MSTALSAAEPPVAKKVPKTLETNSDKRLDNYFWLRDDARKDPQVISYLEAENTYTNSVMQSTEALQKKLYDEILGRIQQTDESVPFRKGDYWYFVRTVEGKQYPINSRKKGSLDAPEEILVDQNQLAAGQKYFRLANFAVSPSQQLLLYGTDVSGDEIYTLTVKDLKTGQLLTDRIAGAYYSVAWAADNKNIFYTVLDEAKRPYKVFRHTIGTDQKNDVLVHHEPDERFTVRVDSSKDDKYLFVQIASQTTSEIRVLPADQPSGEWKTLLPRTANIEYDVVHHNGFFYVVINDKGRNFRLVKMPAKNPSLATATEVIAHRMDALLERVDAFENHLAIGERVNGLRQIRVVDLRTNKSHAIEAPEPAYVFRIDDNPEFNTNILRYTYTSLVTPPSVYDYDMDKRTRDY